MSGSSSNSATPAAWSIVNAYRTLAAFARSLRVTARAWSTWGRFILVRLAICAADTFKQRQLLDHAEPVRVGHALLAQLHDSVAEDPDRPLLWPLLLGAWKRKGT